MCSLLKMSPGRASPSLYFLLEFLVLGHSQLPISSPSVSFSPTSVAALSTLSLASTTTLTRALAPSIVVQSSAFPQVLASSKKKLITPLQTGFSLPT